MPGWGWIVLLLILVPVLLGWRFYTRFRGMCRGIREEMGGFLKSRYPGTEVLREEMGNLVLGLPDGSEKLLEMAEVYTGVAQLPAMGADSQARSAIYEQATGSLSASGDPPRAWIKPLLLHPADAPVAEPAIVQHPIPELGVTVVYPVGASAHGPFVTEADLPELGLDVADLHSLAAQNLGRDFPREMVASALRGEPTAIQFGDGFDASRLLLVPVCLGEGQELIALIPHRDMLLLTPADSELRKLREGLPLLKCEHPPLHTEHLVRVTATGFSLM